MSDTVLVTGGGGFVGGWCIVELLRRGYLVRTTVRNPDDVPAIRAAIGRHVETVGELGFVVADLLRDEGWDAAVKGCTYVLHVASPLSSGEAQDADAMIAPARGGTLRVLRAACAAGVKRVVVTSAAATARRREGTNRISGEAIWADPDDPALDSYRRSKVIAERAAWDFMATAPAETTLATILPGAVFGPVLDHDKPGSSRVIRALLAGRPPFLLHLGLAVVDVRDLAALHVAAMTAPAAAGERFLATGEFLWMKDIAGILREGLGARGGKVPALVLPDWLVRLLALFVPRLRVFASDLGGSMAVSSDKARRMLGFAPRPPRDTILDCAESLLAPDA